MASANIAALKAAWAAKIAVLTYALAIAEANVLLDRYAAALESQEAVATGALSAYTIAGRSVTRRNLADGAGEIERMRAQLAAIIGGPVSYVGMGGYA